MDISKQLHHNIPLNMLSSFPDIEGIMDVYYELIIELRKSPSYKKSPEYDIDSDLNYLYNSPILTSFHVDSTISERVHSLHLKAQYNRFIFIRILFGENSEKHLSTCSTDEFYSALNKYLNNDSDNDSYLLFYNNLKPSDCYVNNEKKVRTLQFLIHDSLFCLSTIIEKIGYIKDLTLFSQSFIADTYYQIFEWDKILDLLYTVFKYAELKANESITPKQKRSLKSNIKKYFTESSTINTNINRDLDYKKMLKNFIQCCFLLESNKKTIDNFINFYNKEISLNETQSKVNYISANYCAEMAISKYRRVKELHSEGKAYKEFISNTHLQNDDLNNNTFQFQFAVERYMINCGYIDEKSKELKRMFANSKLYDVSRYAKSSIDIANIK